MGVFVVIHPDIRHNYVTLEAVAAVWLKDNFKQFQQ